MIWYLVLALLIMAAGMCSAILYNRAVQLRNYKNREMTWDDKCEFVSPQGLPCTRQEFHLDEHYNYNEDTRLFIHWTFSGR